MNFPKRFTDFAAQCAAGAGAATHLVGLPTPTPGSARNFVKGLNWEAVGAAKRETPGRRRAPFPAFVFHSDLSCPSLSLDDFARLHQPLKTITRHIEGEYFESALQGYFHFKTTAGYRPQEAGVAGRLGDEKEGRLASTFNSNDGVYEEFEYEFMRLKNVELEGLDGIKIEHHFSDWCSCSSVGEFSADRAVDIRSHDNPKLDSYITYDVQRLGEAVLACLSESPEYASLAILGQKVVYGQKDERWRIGKNFTAAEIDRLATWLSGTFIKPTQYCHEEEYRMLLVDPSKPGSLLLSDKILPLDDPRIAAAIISSGHF